jgi:hypothetical protein
VRGGLARAEIDGRSRVIATEPRIATATATASHLREMIAEMKNPNVDNSRARHAREILRLIFAAYEAAEKNTVVEL